MSESVWVVIEGFVQVVRPKAIGIDTGDPDDLLWIPKSQIEGLNRNICLPNEIEELEKDAHIETLLIPEWLAEDKSLELD